MEINGIPANATLIVKSKILSGEVDIYNQPIYNIIDITIKALVAFNNTKTSSDTDRDLVEEALTVYLTGTPDIKSWDSIEYNGESYIIDGDLEVWVNPFVANNVNSIVKLRRYNG
jgi:hypothetical protein